MKNLEKWIFINIFVPVKEKQEQIFYLFKFLGILLKYAA